VDLIDAETVAHLNWPSMPCANHRTQPPAFDEYAAGYRLQAARHGLPLCSIFNIVESEDSIFGPIIAREACIALVFPSHLSSDGVPNRLFGAASSLFVALYL